MKILRFRLLKFSIHFSSWMNNSVHEFAKKNQWKDDVSQMIESFSPNLSLCVSHL